MSLATIAVMDAPIARMLDDFGWPLVVGPFRFEAPNGPLLTLFGPLFGFGPG